MTISGVFSLMSTLEGGLLATFLLCGVVLVFILLGVTVFVSSSRYFNGTLTSRRELLGKTMTFRFFLGLEVAAILVSFLGEGDNFGVITTIFAGGVAALMGDGQV